MLLIMSCSFSQGNVELLGTGKVVNGRAQHGWGFTKAAQRKAGTSGLLQENKGIFQKLQLQNEVDKPTLHSAEPVRVTIGAGLLLIYKLGAVTRLTGIFKTILVSKIDLPSYVSW